MVFRHNNLPAVNQNYQCGIVAAYFGGQCAINCGLCVQPIGPMSQAQVLINNYGGVAAQYGPSRNLSSTLVFGPLSINQLASEIDSNRPVIAGISPGGYSYPNFSMHIVLVVGYDVTGPSPRVVVNDPFPYNAFPQQSNPYLRVGGFQIQSGQYSISYDSFVSPMNWANTIYRIQ